MLVNIDPETLTEVVLTALAGIGLWIRKEKTSWAQNNEFVAKSKLSTEVAASELEYLTKMHDELNELRKTVIVHTSKIAFLESLYIPIKQHVDNLTLCDVCQTNNKQILTALDSALAKAVPKEDSSGFDS